MAKHNVKNNRDEERYEMEVDGELAVIEYDFPQEGVIVLTHTFVPEHLEGRGLGSVSYTHLTLPTKLEV